MAIARRSHWPRSDDSNSLAVPWKLVLTVAGRLSRASPLTAATASPRATPGLRLKEMVTEGIWPVWFTDRGPTLCFKFATALIGMSCPVDPKPVEERMYSIERAAGGPCYLGVPFLITLDFFFLLLIL